MVQTLFSNSSAKLLFALVAFGLFVSIAFAENAPPNIESSSSMLRKKTIVCKVDKETLFVQQMPLTESVYECSQLTEGGDDATCAQWDKQGDLKWKDSIVIYGGNLPIYSCSSSQCGNTSSCMPFFNNKQNKPLTYELVWVEFGNQGRCCRKYTIPKEGITLGCTKCAVPPAATPKSTY